MADREESSSQVPGLDFHTFGQKVLFLRTKALLQKMAKDNKKELPLPRFFTSLTRTIIAEKCSGSWRRGETKRGTL